MKELYRRFNIIINLKDAQSRFLNKINNILFHAQSFNSKDFDCNTLCWSLCNDLGLLFDDEESLESYLCDISFSEYLARVQCLLDILWENKNRLQHNFLSTIICDAIDTSPIDLGIRIKIDKKKPAQITYCGAPLLDQKLVDDSLGILGNKEMLPIKLAFEKGLREFLESKKDKSKLRNVLRDMQLSCDEMIKFVFKDKNLGFKHFFKEDRWKKVGFNDYQRQIFYNLNEYIDKMAKHKADSQINEEDAETVIYLTGIFIRLVLLKQLN